MKEVSEGRSTVVPANTVFSVELGQVALRRFKLDEATSPVLQTEDVPIASKNPDQDDGPNETQFLGMRSGNKVKNSSVFGCELVVSLNAYFNLWPETQDACECGEGCFRPVPRDAARAREQRGEVMPGLELMVYTRANIRSCYNMFSTAYKRIVNPDSPSNMATYHEERRERRNGPIIKEDFLFHAKCFLRVTSVCGVMRRFAYGNCHPVGDQLELLDSLFTYKDPEGGGRNFMVPANSLLEPVCTVKLKAGCRIVARATDVSTGEEVNRTYGAGKQF